MTMEETRLGLAEVRALLAQVVEENGADTERKVCRYVNTKGEPDCIVGHVFAKVGFPLETLTEPSSEVSPLNEISLRGEDVQAHLRKQGLFLSEEAMEYLFRAQEVQDGFFDADRRSWGDALQVAEAGRVAGEEAPW